MHSANGKQRVIAFKGGTKNTDNFWQMLNDAVNLIVM
jgi:hypothetical protein